MLSSDRATLKVTFVNSVSLQVQEFFFQLAQELQEIFSSINRRNVGIAFPTVLLTQKSYRVVSQNK